MNKKALTEPPQQPFSLKETHGVTVALTTPSALLELNGYGINFGSKTVLSDISFTVPEKGVVALIGPKGIERTTLLRTIASFGSANFSYQTSGSAFYRGAVLGENDRPELVMQNARLAMASVLENVVVNLPGRNKLKHAMQRELAQQLLKQAGLESLCSRLDETMVSLPIALQRHLSILRHVIANPPLLCIDEPAAGMTDIEAAHLFAYLREESTHRALLVALHSQKHARLLGGQAVLIAHGRVQEQQAIPQIFDSPYSVAGREFARTGKCAAANQTASPENVAKSAEPVIDEVVVEEQLSLEVESAGIKHPNIEHKVELGKFLWLKRGMLAGTPAPGAHGNIEHDLKELQRKGITTLVTLTETALDESSLKPFGIKSVWEPIPDMAAPTIEQGIRICIRIESLLEQGEVVAVHGHAGLGRTGTALAAHLLWKGMSFDSALEYVRRVEPRWVQTQSQVAFLQQFSKIV
jgi:atypical dual specificity phosphatase